MPKVYLSKAEYEKDHGKGALEKKRTVPRANVRTAPYSIDKKPTNVHSRNAGFGGPGRATPGQQFRGNGFSQGFGGYTPAPQQQGFQGGGGNQRRQQQGGGNSNMGGGAYNSNKNSSYDSGYDDDGDMHTSSMGQGGRVNQRKGPVGNKTSTALSTAKVLVASGSHPRKEDIRQLLQAFERGWVPEKKFTEELQKLIF